MQQAKVRLIAHIFTLGGIALFCSSCASNMLMNKGVRGELDFYYPKKVCKARESDTQFIIDFKAKRTEYGMFRKRHFTAIYDLHPTSGLPAKDPSRVSHKPILSEQYQDITIIKSDVPQAMVARDNSTPSLRVDIDSPNKPSIYNEGGLYCLYMKACLGEDEPEATTILIPKERKGRDPEIRVVFLPLTLVFDLVTLPIQIFDIILWEWS